MKNDGASGGITFAAGRLSERGGPFELETAFEAGVLGS
jgi:hypothetical protein